jgi:hypothetical protein
MVPAAGVRLHLVLAGPDRGLRASHAELFDSDYAYFSSFSTSWLEHARRYVDTMAQRFDLGPASQVVEVASNDGYLLQYVKQKGIGCLGIEPTASTAREARRKGLEVREASSASPWPSSSATKERWLT